MGNHPFSASNCEFLSVLFSTIGKNLKLIPLGCISTNGPKSVLMVCKCFPYTQTPDTQCTKIVDLPTFGKDVW